MDRRAFFAGAAGVLEIMAGAQAGDTPTSSAEINRLIEQLGSRRFRQREQAGNALEKIGKPALTALRTASKSHVDGEVRRRAQLLIEAIGKSISGEVHCFGGHNAPVWAVALSDNGDQGFSAGLDATIRGWDCAAGKETRSWDMRPLMMRSLALSSDSARILAGGNMGALVLMDVRTGAELHRFQGHQAGLVRSVALSPDGTRALSGGFDGTMRLWDIKSGRELWSITLAKNGIRSHVYCVAFSLDGKQLLACTGNEIHIRDVKRRVVLQFRQLTRGVTGVFSPDCRRLLWGDTAGVVHVLDMRTSRELRQFRAQPCPGALSSSPQPEFSGTAVVSLALARDGHRLVSGHIDGTVRMWNAATGKELHCAARHTDEVTSVACSRDGKWALSGSRDRTLRLWRMPAGRNG